MLFPSLSLRAYHGKARSRENRMKQIYTCVPASMETKRNDPFDYKLRSLAEVKHQLKYFPADLVVYASYKRYTAGDHREDNERNTDDRDRVSKLRFDLRHLNLQPLQRERFIFLLGPRYNPKKPHSIKIVTKQYPTFLENYFKGMETIKELYLESLRAPDDAVNFRRDPYLREKFIKKHIGKTKEERIEYIKKMKLAQKRHMEEVDRKLAEGDAKVTEELQQKR